MRDFVFSILRKLFRKQLERIEQMARSDERVIVSKERQETRRLCDIQEAESYLDEPVIYFSNENDNPVIGFVVKIELITKAAQPMLVVYDYVTGIEVMVHPSWPALQMYDERVLFALCQLDTNILLTVLYGRYRKFGSVFNKTPCEGKLSLLEILKKLKQNGFREKLEHYRLNSEASGSNETIVS